MPNDGKAGDLTIHRATNIAGANWAEAITAAWQKTVIGIFECGRLLIEAKAELPRGEFIAMCERELPFSERTAQMLMAIAGNERLSNTNHGSLLPSSWRTLYELTKLDDGTWQYIVEQGILNPDLDRKTITNLLNLNKLRDRVAEIERQREELSTARPSAPLGLFNVVCLDPAWPYDDGVSQSPYNADGHRASNPYPEMSLDEIADIALPAADDCVLWLWTTHQFMRHAFPLLDAWGFEEKAIVTWAKDRMGLGRWLRSQSEFCIMAVRGNPPITLTNQTTVINGPLREHSRKPDEFYAMVDSLCHGRKLDFYSREKRDGWEQFGNDTARFAVV